MFEVKISAIAQNQIKKLPYKLRQAVVEMLIELKIDPFAGQPLTRELTGKYKCSVRGYRIVYLIRKKDKIVEILKVRSRRVVYN